MEHKHWLKATDEESLLAALEAAGLCQIVEAHTVDVPEHYAQNLVPASPEIAAILDAQFEQLTAVEYEGKTYFGTGDAWMVDEPVLVEAHQVEVPRHAVLPNHIRLDAIGAIPEVEGYHANLLVIGDDLTDEQKDALPLIDAPRNPVRVWA